jgi:endonuclease-3
MRLKTIEERLERRYGATAWKSRGSAVDVLIATILSQNTSDINSTRAFKSLKSTFSSWESVGVASLGKIENAIKIGGLAKMKATYIRDALERIKKDNGKYDLSGLKRQPTAKSLAYLTSFHGIGEKTAACVLLFAFGLKIMPVDTHVHRISQRLGLVPTGSDRRKTFQFWFGQKNLDDYYNLHLNLVRHGREICLARKPGCADCVINALCGFYKDRKDNG